MPRPEGSLLLLLVACAPAPAPGPAPVPEAEPEPEPHLPIIHEPAVDCSTIREDGDRRGRKFPIDVILVDHERVELRTTSAFMAMHEAAAADGIDLIIYSGFRSMAKLQYFYRCYKTCSCNRCTKAAKPGYSNHQSDHALDIGLREGVHDWLIANAQRFGFRDTVRSEPWHWEYQRRKKRPWPQLCAEESS